MPKVPKGEHDAQYMRTERRLRNAFLVVMKRRKGMGVNTGDIPKRAGTAVSTFYRHHKTLQKMARAVNTEVLNEYDAMLARVTASGGKLVDVIDGTVRFVEKYRATFEMVVEIESVGLMQRVAKKLWSVVQSGSVKYNAQAMAKIEMVYCYEVAAILTRKVKRLEDDAECVRDLMNLSKGGAQRFGFMIK